MESAHARVRDTLYQLKIMAEEECRASRSESCKLAEDLAHVIGLLERCNDHGEN